MTAEQEIRAKAMELAIAFVAALARVTSRGHARQSAAAPEGEVPPDIIEEALRLAGKLEKIISKAPAPIVPESSAHP